MLDNFDKTLLLTVISLCLHCISTIFEIYVMRLIPCVGSYDEHENHSKQIDREIKHWIKSYNEAIKLLLLGTGESGKTTIIKQMKILHIQGFSLKERAEKVQYIRHNVHESIYDIVSNMPSLSIPLQNPRNIQSQHYILKWGVNGPLEYTETYFDHVRVLWRDGGVRECFKRSNEYQLIDSAEYFLDRIDLIEKPDYVPSDADILRCRQKTTGIQKIEFKVKVPKSMHGGVQEFWMFDVGGQRGERKKWIQVFEGINAIWFLVACSDFDQTLREDHTQNRLIEALALFGDVWQSRFLMEAGLIVFLNKQDLLEQKVSQGRSIAPYFPQYEEFQTPGDEYTRTKTFIKSLFTDIITKNRERRQIQASGDKFVIGEMRRPRECYFHFTTATDTDNVVNKHAALLYESGYRGLWTFATPEASYSCCRPMGDEAKVKGGRRKGEGAVSAEDKEEFLGHPTDNKKLLQGTLATLLTAGNTTQGYYYSPPETQHKVIISRGIL